MAMTKKERAEFDALILKTKTLAALRWTEPVKKDIPRPEHSESTSGWDFNSYSGEVYEAWSQAVAHGKGGTRGLSGSQGGIALFSTKLLALKALRYAVECEAAEKLRRIDAQIEEEEVKS